MTTLRRSVIAAHIAGVRFWLAASVAVALLLVAGRASADLHTAHVAYEKQDFKTAFTQFKELAELGQPQAQYALAVMYVRGQGVAPSMTYGHAWASLAAANGEPKGSALATDLESKLTPTSLGISADIQTQFNQATLDKRLLPVILKGKDYQDRDPPRLSKAFMPGYPLGAENKGVQGEAYVEFIIAPDGHPRIPRILYAVPAGFFDATIRESVLKSVFLPARINGQPISSPFSMFYNFTMSSLSLRDYGNLEQRVAKTKLQAEAGDPSAQMLYGMMIAGLPQLKQSRDRAVPWFLKAAQAGAPYAQYQIGTDLLLGRGCQCDSTKGEIWLEKAAQADQSDAQVSLAEFLLTDHSKSDSAAGAIVWLERAAKTGNASAKLLLSAVLAANPAPEIRDPTRALALTDNIEHEYKNDPSLWEIRAAANASRGDYRAAVKAEAKAISEAGGLGWDVAPLEQRRALYVAEKSWSGNLLDF
jgi:TonB family protein